MLAPINNLSRQTDRVTYNNIIFRVLDNGAIYNENYLFLTEHGIYFHPLQFVTVQTETPIKLRFNVFLADNFRHGK